mmetsp:Transcript_76973/g.213943  ORF Transcript_76973/g.213943 Transcript_76973/m.213943 type:complete len:140 (-) Transcript_76973:841-1260(-)
MSGRAIKGRIATQTMPATKQMQAQAGGQDMMQLIAAMPLPMYGPMKGMQSAKTSNGPRHRDIPHQQRMKATSRSIQVVPVLLAFIDSKNCSFVTEPFCISPTVKPLQSQELGAVHRPMTPALFSPSTLYLRLSALVAWP